jgi:DNA invertase Pin-like site-specific DNA recombinase
MIDRGLSAYKGMHRTKGTFGEFLRKVKAGEIARGSMLIVENLDRLSREQVLDALDQFTGLIRSGIKIVTFRGGKETEYDEESINREPWKLQRTLLAMELAHEESEKKAIRLRAAWEAKRNNILERKLTG